MHKKLTYVDKCHHVPTFGDETHGHKFVLSVTVTR